MKIKYFLLSIFILTLVLPGRVNAVAQDDTTKIKNQNKQIFDNRLTDPNETVKQARRTLVLSHNIGFANGEAESNRLIGIGFGYLSHPDTAINYYLKALAGFTTTNNKLGQARVNNNIGNLYKESDYDRSIEYFKEALKVASTLNDADLTATIHLNQGNIYFRKKNFQKAMYEYRLSNATFAKIGNTTNMIQCLQNIGVVYYKQGDLDSAEVLLVDANKQAKARDLNNTVASINLTLTSLFLTKGKFAEAEMYFNEGFTYAKLVKSPKLEYDYKLTKYEKEFKQGDYKNAIYSLREINQLDSIANKGTVSLQLNQLQAQYSQEQQQHINEKIKADQRQQQTLFWATIIVAGLLLVVIFLLISNVNRKAKTNKHLTELNEKVTEQKENLNQINHHLEEIIDERTKDLQVKNKKLADYSLHLSHQIRGPIATLKGLLNLEKDKLIEQDECVKLMNKCVSEIDDNIIDMSGMLHESGKKV